MSEASRLLLAIEGGDRQAAADLLPLVYNELRRLAGLLLDAENPGQTLQPTGLVHEAWLRLVGPDDVPRWDSRRHFFAAAADSMRRILVDNARRKGRLKRGKGWKRLELSDAGAWSTPQPEELLALDEALEEFSQESPQRAELVKLRFFAGLTLEEAALTLGVSRATAERHWAFAQAWLYARLASE